jgi:signal transduction histidine kinase
MKPGTVAKRARLVIIVFALGLIVTVIVTVLIFSRTPSELSSSPTVFYLFSYQIIALIFGMVLVVLLVRWLLRPYRRMVEAARGSPVHPAASKTESEFVVETFQALIEQLQAKEKELEKLHALERTRAERSERFSERLVANIPSGLVTVDSQGTVSSANTQAMKIFGLANTAGLYSSDAETGLFRTALSYQSFFRFSPSMMSFVRDCLGTGAAFRREEVEVILPDGRTRRLGASISPIADSSQNIEGVLCLMTDITEVIELRERMKLQENLANLGEMAAGIAHEFKNSLATIHGYIQLLQTQIETLSSGSSRVTTLELTLNEVRLLSRVVTDFLNFARPQHLNVSPIDLHSVLGACADEVEPLVSAGGISLTIEGVFSTISVDEPLLRRAFSNLLRNAIEAIDPQSSRKTITVSGSVDSGGKARYAHVRISDTGRGIASEDLPRIFIPFFTTKSRGYGIGLALVQKIFVAHGGDVSVEQSTNSGTTFRCRLPLDAPPGAVKES